MAVAAYLRVYVRSDRIGEPAAIAVSAIRSRRLLMNGAYGVWEESLRDDAFVLHVDGRRYVCPRTARLRMLEGVLAFRNAYQGPTASLLVPEAAAERAASELRRIQDRFPGVRSHILTSAFAVPLRWFAAFDPTERALVEVDGVTSIRYRTRIADAARRLHRTVEVLDAAGFDEVVIDPVEELVSWVDEFSGEAILELDYGGVARLFSSADLALDESAADLAASLDALEAEDYEQAGEHYGAAVARWSHAQSLAYVN
jgi:hypothetical protein